MKKPELLAPAGDLEKLKFAISYGADAVYAGAQNYGLREKSKNFSLYELSEGVKFAHGNGKKIYITANIYAHNQDLIGMEDFFYQMENLNVDAVIISDPGVFSVAKRVLKNTGVHISTQANNTNYETALFWQSLGASRIVMARELSLDEITEIKSKTKIELEAFVHGAMCISYSGRCLLSSYLTGRDPNKGNCAQACRWGYHLVEEARPNEYMPIYEDSRGTYILNSKDLCMVGHIPELVKSGICSFKIEGRMKSLYYAATTIKAYRRAIDDFFESPELYNANKNYYIEEVQKNSHRKFTTGFYFNGEGNGAQIYDTNSYVRTHDFVGIVLSYDKETKTATIEQRNKIIVGQTLEALKHHGNNFIFKPVAIWDEDGNVITEAPHAQQIIKMETPEPVEPFDILRIEL
ncbi:MAG: U32 family peptidase [Clostridiales bacterium]|nr:U32 family peptidase [Clostridiales bacterium]